MIKPLFIPLNTEYFEQFRRGDKLSEFRLYGPRWNERTCYLNRPVTLSKGYGKAHRLRAVIVDFRQRDARSLGVDSQKAIMKLFGSLDLPLAQITLSDIRP